MPDVSTEVAIATTTLGSAAADITFSSISSSYTDLRLVIVGKATGSGSVVRLRFNSDTGSNYSNTFLYGDGAGAASSRSTSQTFANLSFGADFRSSQPGMITTDIFSYAGSTNKTLLSNECLDLNGGGTINPSVSLWRSTSAISTINLSLSVDNWAIGTTATLYGIL
jgi:hypothetical protein